MRRGPLLLATLALLTAAVPAASAKPHHKPPHQPPHHQPPAWPVTAPTGFTASVLSTSVGLRWTGVDDQVTTITIRRNNVILAALPPATRSYDDSHVTPGSTYSYTLATTGRINSAETRPVRVTLPHYLVGAAAFSITPQLAGLFDVNEGGNGLGDGTGLSDLVGRGDRGHATTETIKARAVVFDDGKEAVAIATIETQGYFAKYRDGLQGLADIAAASVRPRMPADHILIAADHTHSGPDTIGAWGGVPKAYFDLVYRQTVAAITTAYESRRFADVRAGHSSAYDLIYNQSCPEALYQGGSLDDNLPPPPPGGETLPCPTGSAQGSNGTDGKDGLMRVLQARVPGGGPVVVTFLAYAAHGTVGGPDGLHGDWPQYVGDAVAHKYGGVGIAMEGAVGKTQPCRPHCAFTKPTNPSFRLSGRQAQITANYLAHVDDAILHAGLVRGPVKARQARIREVVSSPTVLGLMAAGGTGFGARLLRSFDPPWMNGNTIATVAHALRVGDVLLAGTPGEGYPEIAFGIRDGTSGAREVVTLGLANDQLGYLIAPASDYPVIAAQAAVNDNIIFNVSPTIGDHVMCADIRLARTIGFAAGSPTFTAYCAPYDAADLAGDPVGAVPVGGVSADDPPLP